MILHFREEKEKGILFSRDSRGEREIQNTKINQNLVQIAMEGCKMASQASCITRSACYLLFVGLLHAKLFILWKHFSAKILNTRVILNIKLATLKWKCWVIKVHLQRWHWCALPLPALSWLLRWLGLEHETGRVYSGMITQVNFKAEKTFYFEFVWANSEQGEKSIHKLNFLWCLITELILNQFWSVTNHTWNTRCI